MNENDKVDVNSPGVSSNKSFTVYHQIDGTHKNTQGWRKQAQKLDFFIVLRPNPCGLPWKLRGMGIRIDPTFTWGTK